MGLYLSVQEHPGTCQAIYMLLKQLGKRAGVPNLHTRRFSHPFATGYLRSEGPERYYHFSFNEGMETAARPQAEVEISAYSRDANHMLRHTQTKM